MEEKHNILVAGAGKIGTILAALLASSNKYSVTLTDIKTEYANHLLSGYPNLEILQCDVHDHSKMKQLLQIYNINALVSSLPYFCNIALATLAKECNSHYFDLTEDVETVREIDALAKDASTAFVSQCGIAPGFINIIANDFIQQLDKADEVKLRCGALPEHASNALKYALTWSTVGLINEYANPCIVLENSEIKEALPLSECEEIQIDGATYEAFHTSGGIGSLAETYAGKVNTMNYKTIRYPGHCEKMRFLMRDLKLKDDRENLKRILENALPTTDQDVVIIYVSVQGIKNNEPVRKTHAQKLYPKKIGNVPCTAIQACTSSAVCAVIDIVLKNPEQYHGRIKQEDFSLSSILDNYFGSYFKA